MNYKRFMRFLPNERKEQLQKVIDMLRIGGDPFVLKSMMGHSSLNTTSIYIHMGRDFNNLKGVNYEQI